MKISNSKVVNTDFTFGVSRQMNFYIAQCLFYSSVYISMASIVVVLNPFNYFKESTASVALTTLSLVLPLALGMIHAASAKMKLVRYLQPTPNKLGLFSLSNQVDITDQTMEIAKYSTIGAGFCMVLALTADLKLFMPAFVIFASLPLAVLYAKLLIKLPIWQRK